MTPCCNLAMDWLDAHHGRALAALTGTDWRALRAFVHLVELWTIADDANAALAIEAMRPVVRTMQPHTVWIAREALAFGVDDPNQRGRLWMLISRSDAGAPEVRR